MRTRSSLELFILAAIERGITTTYDFLMQLGLSVGATNPALRRLLAAKLIEKTTNPSSRRERQEYGITAAGGRELRRALAGLAAGRVPSDIDSVLRIGVLLLSTNGHATKAATYFIKAAKVWGERSEGRAAALEAPDSISNPAIVKTMRGVCDAYRMKAEAEALEYLASETLAKTSRAARPKSRNKRLQRP